MAYVGFESKVWPIRFRDLAVGTRALGLRIRI